MINDLVIYQYNANRSKNKVMAQFMRDPEVLRADIIAIQEPWKNPFINTTHHPAKDTHELLYPVGDERTRVCMFVSKKLANWTHIGHTTDVHELRVRTPEAGEIRLINVYVDGGTYDGLRTLQAITENRSDTSYLILGDFNLHHPVWGGDDARTDKEAETVLELMDSVNLEPWLEPGTKTRVGRQSQDDTSIDLVLASRALSSRLVSCFVDEPVHADSDHLPICTVLDMVTDVVTVPLRRCWKQLNEKQLVDFVTANIAAIPIDRAAIPIGSASIPIGSENTDGIVDQLIAVVQQGVQLSCPIARPSQWAKQGWTPECTAAIKTTRQAFRRWRDAKHDDFEPNMCEFARQELRDELHDEYTHARNRKGKTIGKALQQGFRNWVKETTKQAKGLYQIGKWARNREASSGVIPALKMMNDGLVDELAETNEQKVQVLREAFFPKPPAANMEGASGLRARQTIQFPDITAQEVLDVIRRAPPDKADGPDGIPNRIWKLLINIPAMLTLLVKLFNHCLHSGYNPRHFQQSITVVLRKGGPVISARLNHIVQLH